MSGRLIAQYYVLGAAKKSKFLYSAVPNPHFTLYFPGRPVQSDTVSTFLGSIQLYATINARRLLVHISTTVCSQVLIYTAGRTGAMRAKTPAFNTAAQDSNPGLLARECEALPPRHCALRETCDIYAAATVLQLWVQFTLANQQTSSNSSCQSLTVLLQNKLAFTMRSTSWNENNNSYMLLC